MTKRRLALVIAALVLSAGLGGFWPASRPTVVGALYARVALGSTLAEADAIFALEPQSQCAPTPVVFWKFEGLFDGQNQSTHGRIEPSLETDNIESDPLVARSQLRHFNLQGDFSREVIDDRTTQFKDEKTSQVLATRKHWEWDHEIVIILFDANGRAVEKAYARTREEPFWRRHYERVVEAWPF